MQLLRTSPPHRVPALVATRRSRGYPGHPPRARVDWCQVPVTISILRYRKKTDLEPLLENVSVPKEYDMGTHDSGIQDFLALSKDVLLFIRQAFQSESRLNNDLNVPQFYQAESVE